MRGRHCRPRFCWRSALASPSRQILRRRTDRAGERKRLDHDRHQEARHPAQSRQRKNARRKMLRQAPKPRYTTGRGGRGHHVRPPWLCPAIHPVRTGTAPRDCCPELRGKAALRCKIPCGQGIRPALRPGRAVRVSCADAAAGRALRRRPAVPPDHNANTNSIVALPCDLSSGERAIFALPTGPMPEAMAMYCLPFTA
jgi:hypothetical protein